MNKNNFFAKFANILKRKHDEKISEKVFEFFKFERTATDNIIFGDFGNKDFVHWLGYVHGSIQAILESRLIDGKTVDNYVNITLHIGGQRVDVAIIKDGCKSPHELLQEAKKDLRPDDGEGEKE